MRNNTARSHFDVVSVANAVRSTRFLNEADLRVSQIEVEQVPFFSKGLHGCII